MIQANTPHLTAQMFSFEIQPPVHEPSTASHLVLSMHYCLLSMRRGCLGCKALLPASFQRQLQFPTRLGFLGAFNLPISGSSFGANFSKGFTKADFLAMALARKVPAPNPGANWLIVSWKAFCVFSNSHFACPRS